MNNEVEGIDNENPEVMDAYKLGRQHGVVLLLNALGLVLDESGVISKDMMKEMAMVAIKHEGIELPGSSIQNLKTIQ